MPIEILWGLDGGGGMHAPVEIWRGKMEDKLNLYQSGDIKKLVPKVRIKFWFL
jgi:hypothetical protein